MTYNHINNIIIQRQGETNFVCVKRRVPMNISFGLIIQCIRPWIDVYGASFCVTPGTFAL